MWSRFVGDHQEGVAIRSTVGCLSESFQPLANNQQEYDDGWQRKLLVRLAPVKYVDFSTYEGDNYEIPILKRDVFSGEHELRAIVSDFDSLPDSSPSFMADPHPSRFPDGGDYVPMDVEQLVQSIHVRPRWIQPVVEVAMQKSGIACPVDYSELDAEPLA